MCTLCGKEGTMIYATIYIPGSVCPECYRQARLIHDWATKTHEIGSREKDGMFHVKYKDAFGNVIWDKGYKRQGNAVRCLQKHVEQIMGPYAK